MGERWQEGWGWEGVGVWVGDEQFASIAVKREGIRDEEDGLRGIKIKIKKKKNIK